MAANDRTTHRGKACIDRTGQQDGCPSERCIFCSGEACAFCGAGLSYDPERPRCEHDVCERHLEPVE